MKKMLRVLIHHFISIPAFVFWIIICCIHFPTSAGSFVLALILGIAGCAIIFFFEYVFRKLLPPSKREMEEYRRRCALMKKYDYKPEYRRRLRRLM